MEVKFRAWEKNMSAMIPVENIDFLAKQINTNSAWRMFHEIELMQYTGLKDKNGVEIYEGDYIDCKWGSDDWSGVVEFIEGSFCTNPLSDSKFPSIINECSSIKVIGNIYENPELLNEEQNK